MDVLKNRGYEQWNFGQVEFYGLWIFVEDGIVFGVSAGQINVGGCKQ